VTKSNDVRYLAEVRFDDVPPGDYVISVRVPKKVQTTGPRNRRERSSGHGEACDGDVRRSPYRNRSRGPWQVACHRVGGRQHARA
jgi:hypothetical protein